MDVRDRQYLNHEDILKLNFIRKTALYFFRRHYRFGLRSHIMEVLATEDVKNEKDGIIINGLRWYPKVKPLKMLRIFRTRFNSLKEAEQELKRVKIIAAYLASDHMARSDEFLVDYVEPGKCELILCGLQEYVEGEALYPWGHLDNSHLVSLKEQMGFEGDVDMGTEPWVRNVRKKIQRFVGQIRKMITETQYVPDLAGIGNILITLHGDVKLVDINNISRVFFDPVIRLDEKGYPVCDKSIEALYLLEQKSLGESLPLEDVIYKSFMDPKRIKEVKAIENEFHRSMETEWSASEKRPKISSSPIIH